MSKEDTAGILLLVAGILFIIAFVAGLVSGIMGLVGIVPLLILLSDPWFGVFLFTIIFPIILVSTVYMIFGIIDLVLGIYCLARRGNSTSHFRGLLVAGIVGLITGFGIGILVIIAAFLDQSSVDMHRVQPRRERKPARRPARRTRRISRSERRSMFQHFDQQIVKSMQSAQKSFKAKRWRTVVKHSWTATDALLNKLYTISFGDPPVSLSVKEIIRRLTPQFPRGNQTAATIEEIHRIRSGIKPGSPPVKQDDAERVLAAAHQLCFWFNIQLDADTETIQPVVTREETVPEGFCGVCNLRHRAGQRIQKTPCCSAICHYACLSEWVKVKQVCPLCRKRLQFRDGEVRLRR